VENILTLNDVQVRITHQNPDSNHIVGIIPAKKLAVGLFVANVKKSVGSTIHIKLASLKSTETCPPKFYNTYKISEISPYESEWSYGEIDFNTAIITEPTPFTSIPLSRRETVQNAISTVSVGSKWRSKNIIWVVVDKTEEKLAGRTRLRVWIETEDGRRGQAVYADSIAIKYTFISA
jgi:hypothetical protein